MLLEGAKRISSGIWRGTYQSKEREYQTRKVKYKNAISIVTEESIQYGDGIRR